MPPEALPPELWQLIITFLDDHCFVWSVLRQVSPFLTLVTEDVFARAVFRTCSLRFAGQTLRNLLPHDLQNPNIDHRKDILFLADSEMYWAIFTSLKPPTFRFQPSAFVPADTKARIVLKLCDHPTENEPAPITFEEQATRRVSSNRLAEIFFRPGPDADLKRCTLINEPHFVRFGNQLKSIRIPSLTIDVAAQEISLDWRQLCATFLRDEFICRSQANALGSWSLSLGRNNP
ncbi:Nn.00g078140.m01.CDS01 [Neocucurbitaria sp. VM-36]